MGAVRITQLDGNLPNLALMRLAAFHRARGDEIVFTRSVQRGLMEPDYAHVYGSAIFKFSAARLERFLLEFPGAIVGGTGTASNGTVDEVVGDSWPLDYELYPDFDASIGFTQRGCRLSCKFCVVPAKEGKPREEQSIAAPWPPPIWRGAPWPKHLHLLDNDFFGGPKWRENITAIRCGEFKVSFTQGINVRAMTPEVAEAIASIEYRDDGFSRRRLYTAWDNLKDEEVFFRGIDMLEATGVPARNVMAYMLIGYDKRETWDRIWHRFHRMVERGIRPYPMVYDHQRKDLKRFQRWVVTGLYRAVKFEDYDTSIKTTRPSAADDATLDLFSIR